MPLSVAILSFEGPDRYALIGGLGTRVTELAFAFGEAGYETELYFLGDPDLPSVEEAAPHVRYRRWAQWISQHHRANVYDGEAQKLRDVAESLPRFLTDEIVRAAAARGDRVVVLAEEWQMVPATIELDRRLREAGLRDAATILWNANNTYGFDEIDFDALSRAATITAVSKYMKFELALRGATALVIPNGIPARLLAGAPPELVRRWRAAAPARPLLAKVGRYDPDKRWMQAIDAVAELRASGMQARLLVRGGREAYGAEVFARARERGLRTVQVAAASVDELFARLAETDADVVDLHAFLESDVLAALYAAADATLANSGKEPFGLVGLEVMAAGGLAVCGSTGEEYAEPFGNAIVCDTEDGRELAIALSDLVADPAYAERIRSAGRATARRYTWPTVIHTLERKIAYAERR